MKILDGKALSEQLIDSVKEKASKLKPKLAVVMVGEDPASLIYVRNKKRACETAGIDYEELKYPSSMTQDELLNVIDGLNKDSSVNGFIVQLPLPNHIYLPDVIRAILADLGLNFRREAAVGLCNCHLREVDVRVTVAAFRVGVRRVQIIGDDPVRIDVVEPLRPTGLRQRLVEAGDAVLR